MEITGREKGYIIPVPPQAQPLYLYLSKRYTRCRKFFGSAVGGGRSERAVLMGNTWVQWSKMRHHLSDF